MLRHTGYPEEIKKKNVRACVSTVARVAGFPCSTRIPNIYLFKAILALFESEFSVMDRAAVYI